MQIRIQAAPADISFLAEWYRTYREDGLRGPEADPPKRLGKSGFLTTCYRLAQDAREIFVPAYSSPIEAS